MEIQSPGHAYFRIAHDNYTIIIDPYNSDYTTAYPRLSGLRADKLLISHEHYGHNYHKAVSLSGKPGECKPLHT